MVLGGGWVAMVMVLLDLVVSMIFMSDSSGRSLLLGWVLLDLTMDLMFVDLALVMMIL